MKRRRRRRRSDYSGTLTLATKGCVELDPSGMFTATGTYTGNLIRVWAGLSADADTPLHPWDDNVRMMQLGTIDAPASKWAVPNLTAVGGREPEILVAWGVYQDSSTIRVSPETIWGVADGSSCGSGSGSGSGFLAASNPLMYASKPRYYRLIARPKDRSFLSKSEIIFEYRAHLSGLKYDVWQSVGPASQSVWQLEIRAQDCGLNATLVHLQADDRKVLPRESWTCRGWNLFSRNRLESKASYRSAPPLFVEPA